MKKLFIIGLAAIFCLALAPAAMAKVTMGGMITTDIYYMDQSGELSARGVVQNAINTNNGVDELQINIPQANNRVIVRYKNDDNTLTGYIEMRGGAVGGNGGGNTIDYKYAWLDYKVNDSLHFRFGRQPQAFAVFTPFAANMGWNDGFTLLANFGNVQVTDGDSLKMYYKFNDTVRLEVQIEDPGQDNGEAPIGFGASDATGAVNREESNLPRFDIALPMTFGKFKLEPAFMWLQQDYDQVAAGAEDSVDIWGLSVGASMGFGPVSFWAEVIYGENLGDDTLSGAGGTPAFPYGAFAAMGRPVDSNGDGIVAEIEDSTFFGGWIQMGINFGPATLLTAIGFESIENDGTSLMAANDDMEVDRMGIAVSLPIKVAKNFTIQPAVIYHDYDDSAKDGVNNPLTVDLGDEVLIGVQFSLKF